MRKLHFLVATLMESMPLIAKYGLTRTGKLRLVADPLFSEFCDMTITGVGKENGRNTAANLKDVVCVNYGFAGSKQHDLGDLICVTKVQGCDLTLPSLGKKTAEIKCLDEPSQDYIDDVLFDMESQGICEGLHPDLSLVVFKVISDNSKGMLFHLPGWQNIVHDRIDAMDTLLRNALESGQLT